MLGSKSNFKLRECAEILGVHDWELAWLSAQLTDGKRAEEFEGRALGADGRTVITPFERPFTRADIARVAHARGNFKVEDEARGWLEREKAQEPGKSGGRATIADERCPWAFTPPKRPYGYSGAVLAALTSMQEAGASRPGAVQVLRWWFGKGAAWQAGYDLENVTEAGFTYLGGKKKAHGADNITDLLRKWDLRPV